MTATAASDTSRRAERQIGATRMALIAGTDLDSADGHRLLASKSAGEQSALINRLLYEPAFDLNNELKAGRIGRRSERQQAKVVRLQDDVEVARFVAAIMGDDLRLAKFIGAILEERADVADRPLMAEARTALAGWLESSAQNVEQDYSEEKYTDALQSLTRFDGRNAERVLDDYARTGKPNAEPPQQAAPKARREDFADLVSIFQSHTSGARR